MKINNSPEIKENIEWIKKENDIDGESENNFLNLYKNNNESAFLCDSLCIADCNGNCSCKAGECGCKNRYSRNV